MRHPFTIAVMLIIASAARAEPTEAFARPAAADVAQRFIEAIEADTQADPGARQRALAVMADTEKDPRSLQVAMTDAVIALHPAFGEAMQRMGDESLDAAIAALKPLAQADDPYLSAHARYFLARAFSMQQRYELALPLAQELVSSQPGRTLYLGEALFLLGAAQEHTLQRDQAIETLQMFVRAYPDAPERLWVGARHLLDELRYMEPGTIADVSDRMDYSRRRLEIEQTGRQTQSEQQQIIAILDKLIEQTENQENEQKGGGQGHGQGMGQPMPAPGGGAAGSQMSDSPASQSAAPAGQSDMGALHRVTRGDESDLWGEARQREREQVLNAIKARYPDRYRDLVEQYYRSMQDDDP